MDSFSDGLGSILMVIRTYNKIFVEKIDIKRKNIYFYIEISLIMRYDGIKQIMM